MSPENKQRIIGVVVLLAFIALLIPFLFTSGIRKKQSVADEIPINAEKRELITQQIQNMDNNTAVPTSTDAATPAIVSTSTSELQQAMVSPQELEQPNLNAIPPDSNEGANKLDQSAQISTETVATPEVGMGSTDSIESIKPIKTISKSKHSKKPAVIKKTKIAKPMKGFWSVQVGSFSNQASVQKLVANLYKKGFHVYVQKITTANETLTRVLVGRETSKEKAVKLAKKIEVSMKIKGQIVRKK